MQASHNDLRRELAPVTEAAWSEIDDEATRTLQTVLAARQLVDFKGPLGWDHSAVNLGRTVQLEGPPTADAGERADAGGGTDESGASPGAVERRVRRVQPLIELRLPFVLDRAELDNIDRGAADADLDPLVEAAKTLAWAEDRLVFYGYLAGSDQAASVRGMCDASPHEAPALGGDFTVYPDAIAAALDTLRLAGVMGPYAIVLGPTSYEGLAKTSMPGGYPVLDHVDSLIDGPIVWSSALEGALVASLRGEDFELTCGRDISIGYLAHDARAVTLYFEESLTFRVLTPEAAVPLRIEG